MQFLKVQVSLLLGAAGKAEIKNRERGNLSKLKLLLQSNAAQQSAVIMQGATKNDGRVVRLPNYFK